MWSNLMDNEVRNLIIGCGADRVLFGLFGQICPLVILPFCGFEVLVILPFSKIFNYPSLFEQSDLVSYLLILQNVADLVLVLNPINLIITLAMKRYVTFVNKGFEFNTQKQT